LTKSQKRRVQRLRQLEQQEEEEGHMLAKKKIRSQVWPPKPIADINMAVLLPKEFMALIDSDAPDEELGAVDIGTYTGYLREANR
jgi:hypothetical protein